VGVVKVLAILLTVFLLFACESTIEPTEIEVTEETTVLEIVESKTKPEVIILVEPILEYSFYSPFSDGLVRVEKDGQVGFIDKTGELVIECVGYSTVSPFREGFALVGKYHSDENYYAYGFIDTSGNIVIPLEFFNVHPFKNGTAVFTTENGDCGLIDKEGNIIHIDIEYDYIWPIENGNYRIVKDGSEAIIDNDGKFIISFGYDYLLTR